MVILMVSKRLYLAVEGDDEIDKNTVVITKKNADKIGAKEGDEVIYEDVPGQIYGKARVAISDSISHDTVLINEGLNNEWGEKIQDFIKKDYLKISFNYLIESYNSLNKRLITFKSSNDYWDKKLKRFENILKKQAR